MVRGTFSPARAWWLTVGPTSTRTLGVACPPIAQHQHFQETHRARSAAQVFSQNAGGIAGCRRRERPPRVQLATCNLQQRRIVGLVREQPHASGQRPHSLVGHCGSAILLLIFKVPLWRSSGSTVQRLTPRSSRAPTACHAGPAGGTQYIFAIRARAPRCWCRLNSNVRRRKTHPA